MTSAFLLLLIAAVSFFFSQTAVAVECTNEQLTSFIEFFNSTEIQTKADACETATGGSTEDEFDEDAPLVVTEAMCENSDCKAVLDAFAEYRFPDCETGAFNTTLKAHFEPIIKKMEDAWTAACDGTASMTLSLMLLFFCAMTLYN